MAETQCFTYAMFQDGEAADRAVQGLINASFDPRHIGALILKPEGVEELPMRRKTGIGVGSALGALLGSAVGIALPGIGLIAAGSAWGALGMAAWGGATGALAGTVGGLGLWKDEFDFPREAFERGGVLAGVLVPEERADDAAKALTAAGATEVKVATRPQAEADLEEIGQRPLSP